MRLLCMYVFMQYAMMHASPMPGLWRPSISSQKECEMAAESLGLKYGQVSHAYYSMRYPSECAINPNVCMHAQTILFSQALMNISYRYPKK